MIRWCLIFQSNEMYWIGLCLFCQKKNPNGIINSLLLLENSNGKYFTKDLFDHNPQFNILVLVEFLNPLNTRVIIITLYVYMLCIRIRRCTHHPYTIYNYENKKQKYYVGYCELFNVVLYSYNAKREPLLVDLPH